MCLSRKLIRLLVVMAVLLANPLSFAHAAENDDTLAPLLAWQNKYPFDKIDGQEFWDTPALATRLRAMMDSKAHQFFKDELAHGVVTPLNAKDGILYTEMCKAHDCAAVHVYLFVDTEADKVYICWHDEAASHDLWLENGKTAQLEKGSCVLKEGEKDNMDLLSRLRGAGA